MNINQLIDHYRSVKSTHASLSSSLEEKLAHIVRVYGHMPADTAGSELAKAAHLAWPNRSPGTIKRYLVQLRAIMSRAYKDGLINRNPVIDVPYVHDTVYIDVSTAEVNRLLQYLKWTEPQWYPLALILTQTGARLGEALALTESSYTKHGVRIAKPVNRRSKTVDRVIPYSNKLSAEVASGAIFRTRGLLPHGVEVASVPSCLGRVLDTSTKMLGLPTLRVHDLRHAFAAMLAENGADLADIATALGHTSTSMAMRYRGLVKGRLNSILQQI